jgi:hypothetical protein
MGFAQKVEIDAARRLSTIVTDLVFVAHAWRGQYRSQHSRNTHHAKRSH